METIEHHAGDSEYLIIPNPIYDVVFKYLMEDLESATIVISTLIGEKIKKLELAPLSHTEKKLPLVETPIEDPRTSDEIRLFHLDFTAVIELPDGKEELVMIELQKASEPDDIFRFKRYLSKNFQRKHHAEVTDVETQAIKIVERPIRLFPIFILNFRIEKEVNDLLIRTNRVTQGVFKNRTLESNVDFIQHLSYDILVVQLPNITYIEEQDYQHDEYKRKLFALLKLFDQNSKVKSNEHRLRLIRKFFPGFLERVIRRLEAADSQNPDLEEQMFAEDEYLKALIERDNKIAFFKGEWGKAQYELEKTSEELEKTSEQLEKASEQLEKTSEQLEKTSEQLEKTSEQLEQERKISIQKDQLILAMAKMLKERGVPLEDIKQQTGLTEEQIHAL